MSTNKRLISLAAIVALLAAAIYGSTLTISDKRDGQFAARWFSNKETIYFWYTDEAVTNYINSAAVAFGEKNNVRVLPVLKGTEDFLEEVNRASVDNEQLPDVFLVGNDSLEKAYLAGLAAKIDNDDGYVSEENFGDAAVSAVTYKGKIVGYPVCFDTAALIYNETYLREWARQQALAELKNPGEFENADDSAQSEAGAAEDMEIPEDDPQLIALTDEYFINGIPNTVDEILNIADTFDAPEGLESVMEWDVSDIFVNYWFVGAYMNVGGENGDDASIIDMTNEGVIDTLRKYAELNQFFSMDTETITADSVIQDFIDGKILFTVCSTGIIKTLEDAKADGSFAFDYGIAGLPEVTDELESRALSVTDVAVVNGYSEHMKLANDFARFISSEYADEMYAKSGEVSAYTKADADNGALAIFKAEYNDSVSLPKLMAAGNYWMQMEVLLSRIWSGADVNITVQEIYDQMKLQLE